MSKRGTSVIHSASAVTCDPASLNTRLSTVRVREVQPVVYILAALMAVSAGASLLMRPGFDRLAYGDLVPLLLGIAASAAFFSNAIRDPKSRLFWLLFGIGVLM